VNFTVSDHQGIICGAAVSGEFHRYFLARGADPRRFSWRTASPSSLKARGLDVSYRFSVGALMSGAWARGRRLRLGHGEYPSEFSTWVTGCWKVRDELTKQGTLERLTR